MKQIKKITAIFLGICCIIGALYLIYQDVFTNPHIPQGYTDCEEHYDPNGFMDWTHFCWYQYEPADKLNLPEEYLKVKENDIINIKSYFDNTRSWLKTCDRLDEYDFNPSCIDEEDFWLLFTSEGEPRGSGIYEKYDDYELYFFDTESARLYYMNNNN